MHGSEDHAQGGEATPDAGLLVSAGSGQPCQPQCSNELEKVCITGLQDFLSFVGPVPPMTKMRPKRHTVQ